MILHISTKSHFQSEGEAGDDLVPVTVTQPPNSPDVNLSDLGFFSSLIHDVSQVCTHCTDRVEVMSSVEKAFWDYPADKLEDKWACYYSSLRSVMHELGGSDYKQAHNVGGRPELRSIFLST